MRSLTSARRRARACRTAIGVAPEGLFKRVVHYLFETHGIELHPANQAFLDGGWAEVSPAEGCLFYNEHLNDEPAEKLATVLHELAHLELHTRLQRCCAAPDPVYGSMYLNDGAPALVRYNRRAREEAEANAFAAEFLCPSHAVLQQWQQNPREHSASIAQALGVPISTVQAQLAEALYWLSVGDEVMPYATGPRAFECDASQLEAAMFTAAPALVNAGPGTGKTATLVRRIEYLLDERGASPETFLVLTFSNDAAEELRQRIALRFGETTAARLEISTFHGFGVAFLHHHGHLLNIDAAATILDEAGQEELVAGLLGTVGCAKIVTLHNPQETVQEVVRHIAYLKDRLYHTARFAAALAAWQPAPEDRQRYEAAHVFLDVYGAYEAAKLTRQAIDFADLIALPVRIFETNPALVEQYRKKYRWVLVDEYQDVSRAVAMLLRHLCGPGNPPWVVGDTRQSIYRFRGAAPENVAQFDQDFPGARTFNLDTNYRSCAEIVRVANQLAALMETPTHEEVIPDARWTAGAEIASLGEPAVTVVRATSDLAEREAIAARVAAWRDLGVPACDIAVLARRNIDVRNAVLELGRRGLRATTAGLVTPEGAAGDLAVIVTLPDQPRASLARLAYALGRERFAVQVVNAVIAQALETLGDDGSFATQGYGEGDPLAVAMRRTSDCLYARRYGGDAFAMMCTFLFDGSDYLRRILEQPQDAERSLALGEIVTSLASAAGYRFTHPEAEPQAARLGFAQVFRAALSSASPSLVAPQPTTDAVRVMTCHAAKGLEFPCVIVAGQTLARSLRVYKWLPSSLQPSAQEDSRQADALLFVGATRARRALVVTYATSAGGTVRSRMRDVTSLLSRWHTLHQVAIQDVPPPLALRERVSMGALWGGTADRVLAARYLDKDACVVRTYLEHSLKIHFPTAVRPLYPLFFDALRRAMGRIVRRAHEIGTQVSLDEAEHFFLQSWPQEDVAGHPHQGLYYELALVYIARFAHAYTPLAPTYQQGEFILDDDTTGLWLRLNLLAYYLTADGTPIAIALRPESLAEKSRPQGVLWSALRTAQRVSFMILKQRDPRLQPYVFSAEDGVLYPYVWTRRTQDFETEVDRIARQGQILKHQRFETTVQTWTCDRCPVRLSCPYWLEALGG